MIRVEIHSTEPTPKGSLPPVTNVAGIIHAALRAYGYEVEISPIPAPSVHHKVEDSVTSEMLHRWSVTQKNIVRIIGETVTTQDEFDKPQVTLEVFE